MSRLLTIGSFLLLSAALFACGSDERDPPDGGSPDSGQRIDGQQSQNCGNGVLDDGEDCDTAITSGAAACPSSCDDGDACTTDELLGSGCNARCRAVPITSCSGSESDGCCPVGCDAQSDVDCGTCGNGAIDPGERCDTAIVAGATGACPTVCDDGNACTVDTLSGSGCAVRCQYTLTTQCSATPDGCCPSGCTSDTDADCSASCGDGVVDVGETCDTAIPAGFVGACPTSCDDGVACTSDEIAGAGCNVSCVNREIEACDLMASDGCCPAGCTTADDVDCKAECGNGVIDDGETCDTQIGPGAVGACPTSCDDGIACTVDRLVGAGTCTASCVNAEITQCATASDGCCPPGCSSLNDPDCKAECGNGVLDKNETCDIKIAPGEVGACPTRCDDGIACTADKLVGGGSCTASCSYPAITACVLTSSDGCCPAGCSSLTDADCKAECGNGVLDADETCDTKIAAGQPGACPTSCNDNNVCTSDKLVGGGTCTAQCSFTPITACKLTAKDGCCPQGCNANTDADCQAVCGNGVVEAGENCDTKIAPGDQGACPTACDDGQACTIDKLQGTGCAAICTTTQITSCIVGAKDGCCPKGCNANNDPDCSASCGNGVLESGELCDTGITDPQQAGYCPTDVKECDDGKVCTTDTLDVNGCQTQCINTTITTCGASDKCCPQGCNANNDPDCLPVCGNRVVEAGEYCDIAIKDPLEPGYCPQTAEDCDDGDACTADRLSGKDCTARCDHALITTCGADRCCVANCPFAPDPDCSSCSKQPCGAKDGCCPDLCDIKSDRDCCNAAKCNRLVKDGCCPLGCTSLTDVDCGLIKG